MHSSVAKTPPGWLLAGLELPELSNPPPPHLATNPSLNNRSKTTMSPLGMASEHLAALDQYSARLNRTSSVAQQTKRNISTHAKQTNTITEQKQPAWYRCVTGDVEDVLGSGRPTEGPPRRAIIVVGSRSPESDRVPVEILGRGGVP